MSVQVPELQTAGSPNEVLRTMTAREAWLRAAGAPPERPFLVFPPALAQADFTGTWANRLHEDWIERAPGPAIGDYSGLPINDEARAVADAYPLVDGIRHPSVRPGDRCRTGRFPGRVGIHRTSGRPLRRP